MAKINDIVLIYFEDQPFSFARVEDIMPDTKKDWYHIKLLLLKIPLETVTWILKDAYINGEEFTMGGNRMRLEKIEAPDDTDEDDFVDEDLLKTREPETSENAKAAEKWFPWRIASRKNNIPAQQTKTKHVSKSGNAP